MPNEKYYKAKKARAEFEKDAKELMPKLLKMKIELAEYYELMRWHRLECTEEQYEKLYDGCLRPYESYDVDFLLERLLLFLDKSARENII